MMTMPDHDPLDFDETASVPAPGTTAPAYRQQKPPPHVDTVRALVAGIILTGAIVGVLIIIIAWAFDSDRPQESITTITPVVALLTTLAAGVTGYYFGSKS